MINYAKILSEKEKDNPSPFCRASYLFSNVSDLVKCYGRSLRFPQDANLYHAEMKLALGDIIMQCRLIEREITDMNEPICEFEITDSIVTTNEIISDIIPSNAIAILATYEDKLNKHDTMLWIKKILLYSNVLCQRMGWNFEEVSHLGWQHVMERFEQFEKNGWK
jgi:hypothetical protein